MWNLAGFQAGAFQGFNPDFPYRRGTTLLSGGPRAIGTRGDWTQLGFTPSVFSDRLITHATFGLDDPRDSDLVSLTKRDCRLRNEAYAFSFLYKLSPSCRGELSSAALIRSIYRAESKRPIMSISERHSASSSTLGKLAGVGPNYQSRQARKSLAAI